ncbi:hypothetical protein MKD38_03650 [Cupriavidus sp. WGlv3]|uniref:hypothetical protein n=1 Tax=Cupriavidus sp. WGlv3 TaxID=2919924 RepID=UPI002090656C|nr:hypothetical protein [Cupriavidus sp. WGlv3]MCO4860750.1 hypothetical protein [Cupriavidus sp. WGlv3]
MTALQQPLFFIATHFRKNGSDADRRPSFGTDAPVTGSRRMVSNAPPSKMLSGLR